MPVQQETDGQQARDEQQQQRGGRREGRTHHGRAHVLASPPTSATSEKTNGIREANTAGIYLSIYLSLLKEITAHPLFIMAPGFPEVRGDRVRKALARFMPLRPSRWLVIVCACRTKALHFTPTSFGGRATSRAVCIAGPSYGGAGGSDLIEREPRAKP